MSHGIAINPTEFLSDPQVRPFMRSQRVDLTAPDTPQLNEGVFVIYKHQTEPGKIDIVRYIAPFAYERTDVGLGSESFRIIPPEDGDGYFAFSPLVNGQTPVILELDFNAPRIAAGPLNNRDRQIRSGISTLSIQPWIDAQRYSPMFSIPVPSKVDFVVTFELLPPATAAAIPNTYEIGTGTKRVDFAGVSVYGVTMPQPLYNRLVEKEQQR